MKNPQTTFAPTFLTHIIARIDGVKGTILWLKSEFKDQIVSKFDLGLLNAYKPIHFDRNISEKCSYLSCVKEQ